MSTQPQSPQDSTFSPGEVGGWLLVLCLILIVSYPALTLYRIFSHTIPSLIAAHALNRILLLSVYSLVFIAMSVLSVVAGARLWLVKPDAVRFARGYLVTSLIANIAYFIFWIIVMRPTTRLAFAQMGWYHVVGPVAAFALWYPYLEHSKRVRATYRGL
jgi:hypothetical protein